MKEKKTLRVGYGRVAMDIPKGVGLGGFGNTDARLSENIMDDLCLTCVAISDGEETLLFYSVDLLGVSRKNHRIVSEWVEENLSIPRKNIFITATHNHSAPNVRDGAKSVESFLPTFYEGMQKAAKDAVDSLKTAEMYVGSIDTHQMNYVRRYYRADGTFSGVAYVTPSNAPIAMHETRVDPTLQVIRFRRAGAKDVVMVNFPCHVTTTSGLKRTDVSADWVGGFRDAAEKKLDILFAFYQGAAGNVVPNSSVKGEISNSNHIKHGIELTNYLAKALDNMKLVEFDKIRVVERDHFGHLQLNPPGFNAEEAKEICAAFDRGEDWTEINKLCEKYGYHSYYHAKGILGRSNRTPDMGENIHVSAISLGPVAFVTAPYEMFCTNGVQIKAASPFDMTFVLAYTNHAFGYIPSALGFKNGGYEVEACTFAAGTGEEMVTEYLDMLDELKLDELKD